MRHYNKRLLKTFAAAAVAFVSLPSAVGYLGLVFNEAVHSEVTRDAASCSKKLSHQTSCSLKEQQALVTKNRWQIEEDIAFNLATIPVAASVLL